MAEDVAQIEADGSDSDTCHSERGEGIGPAKWGHGGSQTCSTLVSVFKSPMCSNFVGACFFLKKKRKWGGGNALAMLFVEHGRLGCCHPFPSCLQGLAVHAE